MRTQTDLQAAFALIEASVDEHAQHAQHAENDARPTNVVDLQAGTPRPTTRRTSSLRRALPVVTGAALAASVAALLVVLVASGSSGPQRTPAGTGRPAALGSDGRNLPFTIEQSTGLQVLDVESRASGRLVELASPQVHLSVWVGAPDRHVQISSDLEPVAIGDQSGYYDDGPGDPLTSDESTTSDHSYHYQGSSPAVVWEYAPSAFAVVSGFDPASPPSRALLLAAARGIHLTDSVPLSLPFRLAPDPALGSLTRISMGPRLTTDDAPPYGVVRGGTLCTVVYDLAGTGNGIQVDVDSSYPGDGGGSGVAVTVDGHDARWDVRFHQLVVDLGNKTYVRIVEASYTGGYTLGLRQYEHVFGLLTVVPDVADPSTWIDAHQGLP